MVFWNSIILLLRHFVLTSWFYHIRLPFEKRKRFKKSFRRLANFLKSYGVLKFYISVTQTFCLNKRFRNCYGLFCCQTLGQHKNVSLSWIRFVWPKLWRNYEKNNRKKSVFSTLNWDFIIFGYFLRKGSDWRRVWDD